MEHSACTRCALSTCFPVCMRVHSHAWPLACFHQSGLTQRVVCQRFQGWNAQFVSIYRHLLSILPPLNEKDAELQGAPWHGNKKQCLSQPYVSIYSLGLLLTFFMGLLCFLHMFSLWDVVRWKDYVGYSKAIQNRDFTGTVSIKNKQTKKRELVSVWWLIFSQQGVLAGFISSLVIQADLSVFALQKARSSSYCRLV